MFHSLKLIFNSKWAISLIGLIALSLLIWFGGPLIAVAGREPFSDQVSRLLTILFLTFLWAIVTIYQINKDKRSNEENVNSLLNVNVEEKDKKGIDDEISILRERISKAISILKTSPLLKGRSIYELPWYVMIGPPGTGKTTALHNSGLKFPLEEQLGDEPLAGLGGTRYCDWWFTNKAILIDTAGRYTSQDSNTKHDSKAWLGFLGLLKKYRAHKPLNGAIVTVSLTNLMGDTATERALQARAIKQRLQELKNRLGMNFPVYVVFTKADLVAGFNEFFEGLSQEKREQVFGITFPPQVSGAEGVVNHFNKEFHHLLEDLTSQVNEKIFNVRDKEKRLLIYDFPKQLRMLQAAADDLLKLVFSPNSFEESLLLRGVYLVSATQKGTPIDKVISEATENLGLGKVSLHQYGGQSKGYFVKDLFEKVIFKEQDVGTLTLKNKRHNLLIRRAAIATSCVAIITMSVLWGLSYRGNKLYVDSTDKLLDEFDLIADSGLEEDANVVSLIKVLDYLSEAPYGVSMGESGNSSIIKNFGLYQGSKIGEPLNAAYYRVLNDHFSPFITAALTNDMMENQSYLEYLYETLKTYLMLFNDEKYDSSQVLSWFIQYYERNYPGEINKALRDSLQTHTQALLERGVRNIDYDKSRVELVRQVLSEFPLSERAYQKLKLDYKSSHIPDFKVSNILGRRSYDIFYRESGKKLSDGIPSLYTYNGFHSIFQLESKGIVDSLIEDSWIYGDELDLSEETSGNIIKEVEDKYYQEYIYHWEKLITDLRLKNFNSASEGIEIVDVLSGSEKPIQTLIFSIQRHLKLTTLPETAQDSKVGETARHVADQVVKSKATNIKRYLPVFEDNTREELPGSVVELHFENFLSVSEDDLVTINDSLTILDNELLDIRRNKLNKLPILNDSDNKEISSAVRKLRRALPEPFSDWLINAHSKTTKLSQEGSQSKLNDIWREKVYREYRKALRGKFPLSSSSDIDVKLKDFSKFFGYGGLIDDFFVKYVEQYVDTSRSRWRFTDNVGISNRTLRQFQRAREIRNRFFEVGSQKLKIEFDMEAVYLDQHISNFRFEMGNDAMTYRHGPTRRHSFEWPTLENHSGVKLIFTPPQSGFSITQEYKGAWGLFRMLSHAKKRRVETVTDKVINVEFKGNKAAMRLIPNSVSHPFWLSELENFSCPARL